MVPGSAVPFVNVFRSTPLREGRPVMHQLDDEGLDVSIHAPAGGATGSQEAVQPGVHVSIHAPS